MKTNREGFSPPFFLQKRMACGSLAAARGKNTTADAMTQISSAWRDSSASHLWLLLLSVTVCAIHIWVQGLDMYSTILSIKKKKKKEDWFGLAAFLAHIVAGFKHFQFDAINYPLYSSIPTP